MSDKVPAEKNSTEEMRANSLHYGSSVIADKFPNIIDGLKMINRRIIWFTRHLEKPVGLTSILGTVGEAHTGGESSINDATIRMSQGFKVGNPLIRIDGKNGEYYDPSSAAAPRYLKAMNSEFTSDMFFKGINEKTIPMTPTKDFSTVEPVHMIPKLPMALVLGNITIGYGFKSFVPMVQFENLCDAVIKYAETRKTSIFAKPKPEDYAKYLVPSFPIKNLVKNRDELIASYARGEFKTPIEVDGWVEITPTEITLKAVPYDVDFGDVTSKFRDILAVKSDTPAGKDKAKEKAKMYLNYIASANQLSSEEAEYLFPVRHGKNPFEVWERIKTDLKFSRTMHPIYNYSTEGKAIEADPLILIEAWYRARRFSVVTGLKYKQSELLSKERRINALLIICDDMDRVIDIIRKSTDMRNAIDNLFKEFAAKNLSWKQAEIIASQQVGTLTRTQKSNLLIELETIRKQQEDNLRQFGRLDDIIIEDVKLLRKKYKTQQITRYSDEFKGYVKYGDLGIIQFFDEQDMLELLQQRWNCRKYIHFYDNKCPRRYYVREGVMKSMDNASREIWCKDVLCYPNTKQELTLCVGSDGSTSIVERAIEGVFDGWNIFPITKVFYAIHKNGNITVELSENFTTRKNISKGARTDIVYALPNKTEDIVVFHMTSSAPNMLRVDRILKSNTDLGRLVMTPGGEWTVLGTCSIDKKEVYLNIPDNCTKNISMQHLKIVNIKKLFDDNNDHHLIEVNKATAFGAKLKRHEQVRTLCILEI